MSDRHKSTNQHGAHRSGSGGRGRNRGGVFGVGGYCICNSCGRKVPHQQGIKCTTLKCPDCGRVMIREELLKK